jgi:serine/threonine protein kinase
MHSTLEARTASAELEVAAEAERARRKAGRSFFGDLEASALGKGKMQAATGRRGSTRTPTRGAHSPLPGIAAAAHYAEQRAQRLLHRDDELHLQSLVLLFTLLLNPSGQLDTAYCDPYPWDRKLQNAPFILHHHLNHPQNRGLLPKLLPAIHSLGLPAVRLLRTLCAAFFRPSWYSQKTRISGVAGAYATVYRCALPRWAGGDSVVLKLLDTPEHIQDRCVQVDYHSEVTILEALTKRPSACQIYDYGLDPQGDALHLVLKDYRCSLKQWRMAQPEDPGPRLRLYYAIYREIVVAVGELLQAGVVHFDLKCDNVLLEPLPGRSSLEFWTPTSATPPFRVVLADFGESKLFPQSGGEGRSSKSSLVGSSPATTSREGLGMMSNSDAAVTSRARGTDAFKSPEMLLVGGAPQKHDRRFDRRRRRGAGAASDVWSLGCLLYELVTGKLLFGDSDWLQLVARVTSPGMQLITEERAALVKDLPGVLELLQYILVRDASLRPTLADTLRQVDATLALHGADLPRHGVGMNVQGAVPVPEDSPLAATTSGTEGFQQTPLPLVEFAQIAPGVHVGLLGCATAETIRARKVSRVVALVARREQYRGEDRRTNDGKGSPLEVEMPLRDALADEQLVDCLDACLVGGAGCNVLRAPSQDASSAEILPWIKYVLEIGIDDQYSDERGETMGGSDDGNIVLVAGPGAEGGAALLCVALLVHRRRYSMYEAMVAASHWNLDLHLGAGHIEALELWSRARSLGRRGVADWKN